ncbi:hypothetical protein EMCRGX_G001519 [Ephydatia muelleri]
MSSKVKSTKGTPSVGRKKDHSISDSTPTTSAVLLPQQQIVPEQSSVDEVLHGDDITALHIQQDQLSKLHPQPPPTHVEKKLKKVVVRKALHDKDASKQGHKSVAVLHPLPPHAPITEVRLLGSPHVGPRFDATSTFIAHSVLAPSESYAAALYQDEEMTRPPPIVLPEAQPTETKEVMTYQSTIPPKETHALEQWRRSMEDRRLQQSVISRKLLSSPQLLAMNQGDGFRNIQEERSAIERTIRPLETEKGYQVRSEFWQQQVSIGDDVTGIRSTLTQSEKGLPPELEFVGTPSFVQREKGLASTTGQCAPLYHAWRQSAYLAERRGHIQSTLQNMTVFNPDMQGLEVIGRSPWRKQRQRADSLDSSGDGEEEEGTRNDSMFSSEREDERPASTLDLQPIVCSLPAVGPALRIGAHLVKWEGPPDTTLQQAQDPLEFRVLLEAGLDEMATSHLRLENCGTTAVYYSWQHMPKANPHGAMRRDTQRFYFDTRGGVLLPGQSFPVPFIFKSPNAGVFSETWALQTGPVLARGKPLVFVLRGVAFQEDLHLEKRNAIEDMLARRMASDAAAAMIKRLVESVCTPPHTPPAMETFEMEEDLFISKNPGLFYHHNMVHKLKAMYDIIMSPVTPEGDTPPDSKGGKKVESKVLPAKDKGRKEGEGKKGKQPTIQEEPSREEGEDALGDTSELQGRVVRRPYRMGPLHTLPARGHPSYGG